MAGTLVGIEPEQAPNALPPASDPPDAPQQPRLTRRSFLLGSATAAAGVAFYSCEFARHEISILTHSIAIANLPEAFHNYRIVQISDIHFDEFTEPAFLTRIVDRVNALAPDLLLLTGDFISYGPLPLSFARSAVYRCTDLLRPLTCPQRFAVMGNHDVSIGAPVVRDALLLAEIPLLVNQYLPIERGSQRLWLGGVDDPCNGRPDLHLAIPPPPPRPRQPRRPRPADVPRPRLRRHRR
jgi:predicted MPP superfamily phosphohydrolase